MKVSVVTVAAEEDTRFDTVKKVLVYSHCRESLLKQVHTTRPKGSVRTYGAVRSCLHVY